MTTVKNFALFVWDGPRISIYKLGEAVDHGGVMELALEILWEQHAEFMERDEPLWQVAECDEVVVK